MNIHDQNNKGFLAQRLNRAAVKKYGKKYGFQEQLAEDVGLSSGTISLIMRGRDEAALKAYHKVADFLLAEHKPEKSLVTKQETLKNGIEQWEDFRKRREEKRVKLLDSFMDNFKQPEKEDLLEKEKDLWMAGIAERTAREAGLLKGKEFVATITPRGISSHVQDIPVPKRDYVTELPAPVIQNEFTKWQAWVIMALQVVVIIFLIFP